MGAAQLRHRPKVSDRRRASRGDFVPPFQKYFGTKPVAVRLHGLGQAVKFRLLIGLNWPPIIP
jgi:hypothetical protein